MYEYIDLPLLKVLGFIFLISLVVFIASKDNRTINLLIMIVIVITMSINTRWNYLTTIKNIDHFKHNRILQCTNGINGTLYRVSKKSGWQIGNKNHFYNDIFNIRISDCESLK